jgi:NADH:ubiquinone oxidoreductase subunit B-like Fe-S oxidoreductase
MTSFFDLARREPSKDCCANAGLRGLSWQLTSELAEMVVDLHIRGCPPTPEAPLKGLLALISAA